MLTKDQKSNLEISTGGDFDPVPMDRYTVQIVDVTLVNQFNKFKGKEEDVLNFMFAILDDKPMPDSGGGEAETTRGRYLWRRCSLSINNRSWLGKLAKAAIGRDQTKEEIDAFDPESLIGKQVDVMVSQKESSDGSRIFNNVIEFNKTAKKLEEVEYEPKPTQDIEKATTPAVAPDEDKGEDPDTFIGDLDDEEAKAKSEAPSSDDKAKAETKEDAEAEAAELEAAALEAKAKAARARAKAAKK